MKRKDLDAVNDDFSDFSLSSPAMKIRRLDAELAPIIEEDATVNPVAFGQSMSSQDNFVEQAVENSPIAIDELSGGVPGNEERAIVLFNPMNNLPLLQPRIPLSMSVDSNFLSGFKNRVVWSNGVNVPKSFVGDESNGCLAVVPWVATHCQCPSTPEVEVPGAQVCEMKNADAMDVEDNYDAQSMPRSASECLNQWQQHCMIPQPPNLPTQITWFGGHD